MEKAIIGGTGFYEIGQKVSKKLVETKYGEVEIDIVTIEGMQQLQLVLLMKIMSQGML
jgi:purine nucleoside phosphorylase